MTLTYPTDDLPSRSDGRHVVRAARIHDLPGIVDIHQKAFSDFFLTQMGGGFLRNYYAASLTPRSSTN